MSSLTKMNGMSNVEVISDVKTAELKEMAH